ncbi:hypothetical protein VTP01DRAFT_8829 [Rhizomucor pusillus]|uniref:uncharacterized protein n=1 Tax=Rhizomucor pusillus TaxID=4840 RepID=UPI0037437197
MSSATPQEIYRGCNEALDTLADVWDHMLKLLQNVSQASGKSLRVEPNLTELQQSRRDLDNLFAKLKSSATWLQEHKQALDGSRVMTDTTGQQQLHSAIREQDQLRQESIRVSEQVKALLSQSYALQFQLDMLLASCQDHPVNKTH